MCVFEVSYVHNTWPVVHGEIHVQISLVCMRNCDSFTYQNTSSWLSLVKSRPCYYYIGSIIGHLFRFVLPFIHEIWNNIWLNEQWPLLDGYYEWRTKEYTVFGMIYDTQLTYDRYASAWAEQCHFIFHQIHFMFWGKIQISNTEAN